MLELSHVAHSYCLIAFYRLRQGVERLFCIMAILKREPACEAGSFLDLATAADTE